MPEELNIEAGAQMDRGLNAYQEFIDTYKIITDISDAELLKIPEKCEKAFLKTQKDITEKEFELGKKAFQNKLKHKASDWYDWCVKNWGTCDLFRYKSLKDEKAATVRG